jgi:hypothetical protein
LNIPLGFRDQNREFPKEEKADPEVMRPYYKGMSTILEKKSRSGADNVAEKKKDDIVHRDCQRTLLEGTGPTLLFTSVVKQKVLYLFIFIVIGTRC